jgi:hypothetical protein
MRSKKIVHLLKSLYIKELSIILKNAMNHFSGFCKSIQINPSWGDFTKIMNFSSSESQKNNSIFISLPYISRLYDNELFFVFSELLS